MRDKGKIIAGLVCFLVLVTFPMWRTLGAAGHDSPPELKLPENETRCVEDTGYMTAHHMDLLDDWRDAVVRRGKRDYTSKAFGTQYEMSLTRTCMGCHNNRKAFCLECHSFANVELRCWDCHVEPKGN